MKTIVSIHAEAARLYLKGIPFLNHPGPTDAHREQRARLAADGAEQRLSGLPGRPPVETAMTVPTPLRIGISSCLLGETVRYDGGHKRDPYLVETLGRLVEWVPVCPEVEMGAGHASRNDPAGARTPAGSTAYGSSAGAAGSSPVGCNGSPEAGSDRWRRPP